MINMEKYEILKRDYIALESVSKQLTEHIDFLNNEIDMLKFQLKAADSVNEQKDKEIKNLLLNLTNQNKQ